MNDAVDVDPVEVADPDSSGDIWGDLESAFDREYEDEVPPLESAPEAVVSDEPKVVEETPPPVAEEVKPEQPPEPPEPPKVEQVQPVEPPFPEMPSGEQLAQVRQQYMQQLASSYALGEAETELVETNIAAALPQLAGALHMRIAESVTQTLGQMLPQLIASQLQYVQQAQSSTQRFFGEWPELNKPEYQGTLAQVAQMYRQIKPRATADEFIRDVGIQAWTALGLPVQQLLTRGQAATPPAPQPTVDTGGYAPATPGAPARSQRPPQQSDNWFAQTAEEFMSDDY